MGERPGGGTKLEERNVAFASEGARAGSLAPDRTGAVNTVDRAGSSTRGVLPAWVGGGAEPGRIVAFSIPPVGPAAGRGSSFGARACGATGDGARMVSCITPELARGVGCGLSRAGGADGATGAGPTLVISRALAAMTDGRDSTLAAAAEGRSSARASILPAASAWAGREAAGAGPLVARGTSL